MERPEPMNPLGAAKENPRLTSVGNSSVPGMPSSGGGGGANMQQMMMLMQMFDKIKSQGGKPMPGGGGGSTLGGVGDVQAP